MILIAKLLTGVKYIHVILIAKMMLNNSVVSDIQSQSQFQKCTSPMSLLKFRSYCRHSASSISTGEARLSGASGKLVSVRDRPN